jgi:hypothetical protein
LYYFYLKSPDGTDLGRKDVNTAEVMVSCDGDEGKLTRAVVKSATPTGVKVSAQDLPKVPIQLLGGKLLGKFSRAWVSVIVGRERRVKGSRRLYGTLIDPAAGTFILGYADVDSGQLFPSVDGKLSKDWGSAEVLLRLLVEGRPQR